MAGALWGVADLASRWGRTERRVREIVLDEGVPHLKLSTRGKYIRWSEVKFLPEAVEAWERSRGVVSVSSPRDVSPTPGAAVRPAKRHPLLGV